MGMKLCLHSKPSYIGTMFNRAVLLVVLSLAVSLLVTLPGRTAASVDTNSVLELSARTESVAGPSVLYRLILQHRDTAAVYSDIDDDCCKKALVTPFMTCAPDSAVMPAQIPTPSLDVTRAVSMPAGPPPAGLYSSGIYRPPILLS